ncbi:MAG: hypothetical protein IKI29_00855 [Clostridia bacterium]|nr:hypothetical protein [Clostridia bacterium]
MIYAKDGWTTIQEANAEKHILEISCYAENGVVTQVRIRHNDGEEEKFTKDLTGEYKLPMPVDEFKKAFTKGLIKFK